VERLSSIDDVGAITALTWALEVGDPHRFVSIADAVSYCGLTAAFRSSAGKQQRGPRLSNYVERLAAFRTEAKHRKMFV
jgi:transposase